MGGGERHPPGDGAGPLAVALFQALAEQAHALPVKPEQLDQAAAFAAEGEQGAAERICDASHIRSYVSELDMWRRVPGTANSAVMTNFAAT